MEISIKKTVNSTVALFQRGLFHIMGSTVLNKVIAFITNIFLVRILSKNDYGVFSSAFNVFLIVSLFTGFGIPSATLYYASGKEDEETRQTVYAFSFRYGFLVSIILCVAIFLYGMFGNVGIEETRPYILYLSLLPLLGFLLDYYAIILRTRKDNKKYALLLNVNSISYAFFAVTGSYFFGISGTIAGRYLAFLVTSILGLCFTKKYLARKKTDHLGKQKRKEVIRYAGYSGCVSALNNILYRIDIYLISVLIADATILATYKTAAIIPENMNFIPQSILIVFMPLFIENQENKDWVVTRAKRLFRNMALVCGIISLFMIVFARVIIRILWGTQYLDGITFFRILAVSFFFLGVFRSTSTNILQALGKVRYNLYVSVVASISNIILDFILIKYWGARGAAMATLSVTIIASLMSFPYLFHTLKNYKKEIKE